MIGYTCQCVCVRARAMCVRQHEHKCVLVCIDVIVSSFVWERRRGTEHHVKQQLGQLAAFTTREWTQPAIPVTANHASAATQSSQTRCKHITSLSQADHKHILTARQPASLPFRNPLLVLLQLMRRRTCRTGEGGTPGVRRPQNNIMWSPGLL